MSLVLSYQSTGKAALEARAPLVSPRPVLVILLTFAHLNLCWHISRTMLVPLCDGGAHIASAWCAVAWVPGAALMDRLGLLAGLPLLLAGSWLAGLLLFDTLHRIASFDPRPLGPNAWRLWVVAVLWLGWLPLPTSLTFIWQFRTWAVC